jgi:hypothetical protein
MTLGPLFWDKVNKNGPVPLSQPELGNCWVWTASKTEKGYGKFRHEGKVRRAHRLSYEKVHGQIPKSLSIDHRCHNKSCVRPTHLKPTTHKQNMENRPGANNGSRSGIRGVNYHTDTGKWIVQAMHQGKNHYGGLFDDLHDAEQAAIDLRKSLFTNNELDR